MLRKFKVTVVCYPLHSLLVDTKSRHSFFQPNLPHIFKGNKEVKAGLYHQITEVFEYVYV